MSEGKVKKQCGKQNGEQAGEQNKKRGVGKLRDPEYDVRDAKFAESCAKCARQRICMFRDSLEGPEAVCIVLVERGTYNCESCLRYKKYGGCVFECCFFTKMENGKPWV